MLSTIINKSKNRISNEDGTNSKNKDNKSDFLNILKIKDTKAIIVNIKNINIKLKKVSDITKQVASNFKDDTSHTTKEKLTGIKDTLNHSLSLEKLSTITSTTIDIKENEQGQKPSSTIVPSKKDLKNLELSDLVIMNSISYEFDKRFQCYFERDSFTSSDPFNNPYNNIYYLFVDKNNNRNVISIAIIEKDVSIKDDIWNNIKGDDIAMLEIKPEQAKEIKEELMPKDTNNFYPFRKDGKIIGYVMFAYQICGLNNE